jgi:methionine-S-sulfoxide reductase
MTEAAEVRVMRDRLLVLLALAALGLAVVGFGVNANTSDETDEAVPDDAATATFAGGCFWCTEAAFDQTEGVYEAVSGYTGGSVPNPTYEQVTTGTTGHAEAVQLRYDPERISYDELLTIYWRTIDPTDAGGQLYDRGTQYRTVIFHHDDEQRALAEASRDALAASGRFDEPIVTEILEAGPFYPAEEYHQDFYLKASDYYEAYVDGSQRYPFLERIWGDESVDGSAEPQQSE